MQSSKRRETYQRIPPPPHQLRERLHTTSLHERIAAARVIQGTTRAPCARAVLARGARVRCSRAACARAVCTRLSKSGEQIVGQDKRGQVWQRLPERLRDSRHPVVVQQERVQPFQDGHALDLFDLVVREVDDVKLVLRRRKILDHRDLVACVAGCSSHTGRGV